MSACTCGPRGPCGPCDAAGSRITLGRTIFLRQRLCSRRVTPAWTCGTGRTLRSMRWRRVPYHTWAYDLPAVAIMLAQGHASMDLRHRADPAVHAMPQGPVTHLGARSSCGDPAVAIMLAQGHASMHLRHRADPAVHAMAQGTVSHLGARSSCGDPAVAIMLPQGQASMDLRHRADPAVHAMPQGPESHLGAQSSCSDPALERRGHVHIIPSRNVHCRSGFLQCLKHGPRMRRVPVFPCSG